MPLMPRVKWESVEQYVEYLRHEAAYMLFVTEYIAGKEVLEIGCGSGYGANELSDSVSGIVAIDISEKVISHCHDRYRKDNLVFMKADGLKLPFKDGSFDIALSFQVMEHIEQKMVFNYLSEIRRVLKRGGVFLVSTPNPKLRLLPFQKPWNPEHKKEYTDMELKNLLRKVFEEVKVYGLCCSSEILSIERHRVKQSPFRVYIVTPFYRVLNSVLPRSILSYLKTIKQSLPIRKTNHQLVPEETFIARFSITDFRVDPGCPHDCLDLYGICTKAET